MAYRGGDLDLRTPRTWGTSAPETPVPPPYEPPSRPRGAYTPGPIWVDEVVLACVNHAYDVALAHRAGEVRLEHLLHALTRIDAAAEVLESRGVRVAALRRESATVIASELPVGLTNTKSGPRHSEELGHVLRAASGIASRRNAPAGVDDLLHLMLDVEPDLPGLALLGRIGGRSAPAGETFYARPSAGYGQPYGYGEAARAAAAPFQSRANRLDFQGASLEGTAATHVDLSPVVDRVGTIERSVTAGFEQFSLALASIENDLRLRMTEAVDLTPLVNRLEIIEEAVLSRDAERALQELAQRLDRLEATLGSERTRAVEASSALRDEFVTLGQSLEAQRTGIVASVLEPLNGLLGEVATKVETRQAQAGEGLRLLGERLTTIERMVAEVQTSGREDLAEIQEALVKINANQHTLAGSIEQWRTEGRHAVDVLRHDLRQGNESVSAGVEALAPRFTTLEEEAQRLLGVVDGLSGTMENMHRVTVERYYRRNRFWYWLFGTDDWVASSWPSQSHRIAEELRAVKAAPRR